MTEKKRISAKQIVADIKSGMDDSRLMSKYALTEKGLQILKKKLEDAGITQAERQEAQGPSSRAIDKSADKKALAGNISVAIKGGLTDKDVMGRFGIPENKLPQVYSALVKGGYLTQEDLDQRNIKARKKTTGESESQGPVEYKWTCPACNTPQSKEFVECPQCGIIVEKYQAKIAREKQAKEEESARKSNVQRDGRSSLKDQSMSPLTISNDVSPLVKKLEALKEAHESGLLKITELDAKRLELLDGFQGFYRIAVLDKMLEDGLISIEDHKRKSREVSKIEEKLENLDKALEAGVINQEEYQYKKAEIFRPIHNARGSSMNFSYSVGINESSSTPRDVEALINQGYATDVTRYIKEGYNIFSNNIGSSIIFTILASILLNLTVGLINYPLLAGYFYVAFKSMRGEKAELGDFFHGFSMFFPLFLANLFATFLVTVGIMFCLIPGIYLAISYMFIMPLIMEKKIDFWPAMETSRKLITKNFGAFLGLAFLIGLINFVGALFCGIGLLVTMPIGWYAMAAAYSDIVGLDK